MVSSNTSQFDARIKILRDEINKLAYLDVNKNWINYLKKIKFLGAEFTERTSSLCESSAKLYFLNFKISALNYSLLREQR